MVRALLVILCRHRKRLRVIANLRQGTVVEEEDFIMVVREGSLVVVVVGEGGVDGAKAMILEEEDTTTLDHLRCLLEADQVGVDRKVRRLGRGSQTVMEGGGESRGHIARRAELVGRKAKA